MTSLDHLTKFNPEELLVLDGTHWLVTVRGKQLTFGDTVVLPKRPIPTFNDVTANEAVELLHLLGALETVALTDLGAARVNAVAAMMKDPFVHFHFFPRYSETKAALGREWVDEDWPRAINLRDVDTSTEVLTELRDLISAALAAQ